MALADPTIVGPARVGTAVKLTTGTWDLKPSSFSYQWLLNGQPIPGATKSTYTPVVRDLDEQLSVRIDAKRSGYPTTEIVTEAVTVEPGAAAKSKSAPTVKVSGKAVTSTKLGKTLVGSAGSWSKKAGWFDYQWEVKLPGDVWRPIEGASTPSLYLDAADTDDFVVGSSYRLAVMWIRSGHDGAIAYSKAVKITG